MALAIVFLTGSDPGFDIVSYDLRDEVSGVFSLDLLLQSTNPAIHMSELVGQAVALDLGSASTLPRVTGIVREVQVVSTETTGQTRYLLRIVAPLWLTTRRVNHRIFQDLTVPAIVEQIIADYAGAIAAPRLLLAGKYLERPYTAQYGETDHDFIFRLLSEEGIATFFDHADGSAWVLCDQTDALTGEYSPAIPYVDRATDYGLPMPSVQAVVVTARLKAAQIAVRDFDHLKPSFTIEARATANGATLYMNEITPETFSYDVGQVRTEQEAQYRGQRLLEAHRAPRKHVMMTANFALGPGTRMRLTGHPRDDVNGHLLVIRVTIHGELLASSQTIEAIDAASPFRPRRLPPPRIIGTQTAFVVATKFGQEIDADAYGQVRVQFRWDRRGLGVNTTRRVRVSQAWAGPGYGLMCLPRVGDEVVVDFLDGDPDQPIIIGRVHNGVNVRPFGGDAEQTISAWRTLSSPGGGGYNEILLDDRAGSERVEIHAQHDFRHTTLNDAARSVGNNDTHQVAGNSSSSVSGNSSSGVKGNGSSNVAGNQTMTSGTLSISTGPYSLQAGTITESADGSITTTAGDKLTENSTNHFVNTGGLWATAESIVQVVAPKMVVFSPDIMFDAGGSSVHITSAGIEIKSAGTVTIIGDVVDVKGNPIKLNS